MITKTDFVSGRIQQCKQQEVQAEEFVECERKKSWDIMMCLNTDQYQRAALESTFTQT